MKQDMKAEHNHSPKGSTDNNGKNVVFEKSAFSFKELIW